MNYVGTELELFQHAANWKRYWSAAVRPYVSGRVLDAGCGFGANARYVVNERVTSYTFLEPDAQLLQLVNERAGLPSSVHQRSVHGTTLDLNGEHFDTLLYIDVLEHIEDPTAELQRACDLLHSGGHLIIVVPAFQFLYSPFDRAIGHHRRYTRTMLRSQLPAGLTIQHMQYMDSIGLLLSLGNKIALRKAAPTIDQITFWDRNIIPLSRLIDKLVLRSFGRSLIAVVRKP